MTVRRCDSARVRGANPNPPSHYRTVAPSHRPVSLLVLLTLAVACGSGCGAPESEFRPTATIRDLMVSVIDPTADLVWQSVSTTITQTGTDERAPRTEEEWDEVRRHTIQLIEATNLLLVSGRQVARPSDKSAFPGIELEPAEIQSLLDRDRATWATLTHGLHDAGMTALKAIEAKDADGLLTAGEGIQEACENCHLKYWYPNAPPPPGAPPAP